MENSSWSERWSAGKIGFHESRVNNNLVSHFSRLGAVKESHVLVPLCGKTVDLIWLAERVGHVTGIEFVETAVEQFFADNELEPTRRDVGENTSEYRCGNLTILRADFFELPALAPGLLEPIDCVWDRAALVALPKPDRARYAKTLATIAPSATLLLNSFDYDQSVMHGPPFSVTPEEVEFHYSGQSGDSSVELLSRANVIDRVPFKERGHQYWNSSCYLIKLADADEIAPTRRRQRASSS